MVMSEDCYFFIDPSVPQEQQKMSVLCVECHNEHMPDTGMFWAGSREGYGPFNYKCCLCGKFVHQVEECQNTDPKN